MLHHLLDSRNYNLLLLAAESGNVKPIKKLLQYSIESQLLENDITAQSLAWENCHFDVLLELLQANLPFPQQIEVSECSEELRSFIESSEEFHKMIEAQNMDKLDEIIQKYPNLKYFYNLLNESALKVALELDSTDIYEIEIPSKNLLNISTRHKTYGTLAHELCHYALHAVYGNKANPYTKLDREAEKRFQKVINACKVNKDNEEVISAVYENCEKHVQPSELIVRPAQLIAMYIHQPEKLKEVVEYFPELFEYFENVICGIDDSVMDIDGRVAWKSSYVYSRLTDSNKVKVQNSLVNFKNVKVKLSELVPENSTFFESLTSEQIVKLLKNGFLDFDDPHFRDIEELIDVRWGNLGDVLRNEILSSNLKFDGEVVEFGRIYELYPDAFGCLASEQLFEVLKGDKLAIGVSNGWNKCSENVNEFYIDRKFIPEDVKLIYFDYEGQVDHQISHEDSHKCPNIVKSPDSTRRQFNDPKTPSDELNVHPTAKSAVHQPDGSLGLHSSNLSNPGTFQEYYTKFTKQNFDEYHKKLTKIRQNSNFNSQDYNLNQKHFHDLYKNSSQIIEQAENDRILILSGETGAGSLIKNLRKTNENLGKMDKTSENSVENLRKMGKNSANSEKLDSNLEKSGQNLGKTDEKMEKVDENSKNSVESLRKTVKNSQNLGKIDENTEKIAANSENSVKKWQHKGLGHLGEASGGLRAGQQVSGAVKGSQQQPGVSQAGQQQLGTSQAAQQQPEALKATQKHPGALQADQQQPEASHAVQQQPGATTAAQPFPGASQATTQHSEASQAVQRQLGASQAVKEQPRPLHTLRRHRKQCLVIKSKRDLHIKKRRI
ncbi:uncharacterized protein [Chironomus tepperi]|uniref:uncharacterized protein n=1 Tax=Chironomus tepperi TaxID=113505 RepID=UPI00391F3CD9